MTKPDLYIALFRHEDDVDVFTFYFVPDDKLKWLINVNCLHCGRSGSMLIEPNDLQW